MNTPPTFTDPDLDAAIEAAMAPVTAAATAVVAPIEAPAVSGVDMSAYFDTSEDAPEVVVEQANIASTAPADDVAPTMLEMVRANAALASQLAAARAPTAVVAPAEQELPEPELYDPASLVFTADEEAAYAPAKSAIDKMVKAGIAAYHKQHAQVQAQAMRAQIDDAKAAVQHNAVAAERAGDAAFVARMRVEVPGLDSTIANPQWKAHLAKFVPGTGGTQTMADLLRNAAQTKNIGAIKEIVSSFAAPAATAVISAAPGKAQATVSAITPPPKTKQMFAYSKFNEAAEDTRRGKMDYATFKGIENQYYDAVAAERVNYSA